MKKVITTAFICLLLDQITKWWIVKNLGPTPYMWDKDIWIIRDFARLTLTYNRGLIFGTFQNSPLVVNLVIVVASIILVIYTLTELKRNGHVLSLYAVGMIFGGALGNTVDRVRLGKVVDFVAVGNFPVFNVADSSIVLGILLLIVSYLVEGHFSAKAPEAHPEPALSDSSVIRSDESPVVPGESNRSLSEGGILQDVVQQVIQGRIENLDHDGGLDSNQDDEQTGEGKAENLPSGQVG